MGIDLEKAVRDLAGSIVGFGDAAQVAEGERLVLVAAVAALVKTHPHPETFATEFRRLWQQAGQQHANEGIGPQGLAGIGSVLATLEANCAVRLNVRPPDVADPPALG